MRSCWAYGANDAALNRIISYSDYLPFVPIFGDGQEPLTPVFVEDIGRLYALLVDNPDKSRNTTFGLGGPDLVTLDQFLHLALRAMGRRRPILHIPIPVGKIQGVIMYLPGQAAVPRCRRLRGCRRRRDRRRPAAIGRAVPGVPGDADEGGAGKLSEGAGR